MRMRSRVPTGAKCAAIRSRIAFVKKPIARRKKKYKWTSQKYF